MEETKHKKIRRAVLIGVLFFLSFFYGSATFASPAYLIFAPATKTVAVGQTFAVDIAVTQLEKAMNAVQGNISFPNDKLDVVSLGKSGSIISLWIQEPSFSNASGKINFEGVVLNPGFSGTYGKILTVNFKAKAIGMAKVNFGYGSILANDGQGTNIITALGGGSYEIKVKEIAPTHEEPAVVTQVPTAPSLVSETHLDQSRWYSLNEVKLNWELIGGADGVSLSVDDNPTTVPDTQSEGAIKSYVFEKLADGVWYAHVRFHNRIGWGEAAHYKFQIDTTAPSKLDIKKIEQTAPNLNQARVTLEAADATSGLDYFEIIIDEKDPIIKAANENFVFETPVLSDGEHNLAIKVFDKAGNFIERNALFSISAEKPFSIAQKQILNIVIILLIAILALLVVIAFLLYAIWRAQRKIRNLESQMHKQLYHKKK